MCRRRERREGEGREREGRGEGGLRLLAWKETRTGMVGSLDGVEGTKASRSLRVRRDNCQGVTRDDVAA